MNNNTQAIDMVKETQFMRQSGLINSDYFNEPINIIGVGATGSFTTLVLAKMGFNKISVWDKDNVELHNLPNQFYRMTDVGHPKVEMLKEIIKLLTNIRIKTHNTLYLKSHLSGITISGVDSMPVREQIWSSIKNNKDVPLYIDARMGGEVMMVLAIHPSDSEDIKYYESTLYKSDETINIRCTQQAIIYTLLHQTGYIANVVKKFVMDEPFSKRVIFDTKNNIIL